MNITPVSGAFQLKYLYAREDNAQEDDCQKNVNCGLKQIIQCVLYKGTICPCFIFAHFVLFSVSGLRFAKFKCLILSLFYNNIVGANSTRDKTISRSENITEKKYSPVVTYNVTVSTNDIKLHKWSDFDC